MNLYLVERIDDPIKCWSYCGAFVCIAKSEQDARDTYPGYKNCYDDWKNGKTGDDWWVLYSNINSDLKVTFLGIGQPDLLLANSLNRPYLPDYPIILTKEYEG